jgi:sialic acid synthase SpsE
VSAVVIAVIGALGVIFGGIITGIFNRRKLGADASKIITDAAAGAVELLRGENTRILAEVHEIRDEAEQARNEAQMAREETYQLRQDARVTRDMAVAHSVWDVQAVEMAEAQGVHLPPAPPLYPQDRGPALP